MTASPTVSLVIPGRNCGRTIGACLDAVEPMLHRPETHLAEILFVDDGSTDNTVDIARKHAGVTIIQGEGRGPGAARNLGWRKAASDLVWFVDSDCVAEPDALVLLLPHMGQDSVGGVSGSYGNMRPGSLLACLIHEEIIARHRRMRKSGPEVDFLATFNVLYRRDVLERLGGLDERYLKGQDAELSFRVMEAGYRLRFEFDSRVKHFHEDRWRRYLRTQRQQGYWRVFLHLEHRGHSAGDSYSSVIDHLQPVFAMLSLGTLPLILFTWTWWIPLAIVALLVISTLPMTMKMVRATGRPDYLAFAWLSFLRAYWRGVGMSFGTLAWIGTKMRAPRRTGDADRDTQAVQVPDQRPATNEE